MKFIPYKRIRKYLIASSYGMKSFFALLILWFLVSCSGFIKPFFLPHPITVAITAKSLFTNSELLKDITVSSYRIIMGFGAGCIIAIPLGFILGLHKKTEKYILPIVAFIRYTPASAFVPLLILWFGIGDFEKIFFIFLGVSPFLLLMTFDVVKNNKKEYLEIAETLGAKHKDLITKIIVPQSLPGIWNAMRISMGWSWNFVVLAELVAATSGLGHLIITSQRFLKTPSVVVAILIIGIIGLATDALFKIGHTIFFPWSQKTYAQN